MSATNERAARCNGRRGGSVVAVRRADSTHAPRGCFELVGICEGIGGCRRARRYFVNADRSMVHFLDADRCEVVVASGRLRWRIACDERREVVERRRLDAWREGGAA